MKYPYSNSVTSNVNSPPIDCLTTDYSVGEVMSVCGQVSSVGSVGGGSGAGGGGSVGGHDHVTGMSDVPRE